MRVFITFLLSLSFFLLRGGTHARAHHFFSQNWEFSAFKAENNHLKHLKSTHHRHTVKEYFLSIEDEDEDTVLSRKYTLLSPDFITIAYTFTLSYFLSYLTILLFSRTVPFDSSSKYITLRVLRI